MSKIQPVQEVTNLVSHRNYTGASLMAKTHGKNGRPLLRAVGSPPETRVTRELAAIIMEDAPDKTVEGVRAYLSLPPK